MATEQDASGSGGAPAGGEATATSRVLSPLRNREDELWLDRYARLFGFGWLRDRLGLSMPPSLLFAALVTVGWASTATALDLFVFGVTPIYVVNPYFLLQPAILVVAAYGAHSLQSSYRDAVAEMHLEERTDNPERFRNIIPDWLPWGLFGLTAAIQLVRTVLDHSLMSTTGLFANAVVNPLLYAPILVQFLVVYVAIEFVVPWRLYTSDVGVHFLDPHGVGGLRPIGELVKKAYYYVVLGLVVYGLITYGPGLEDWGVSAASGTIFTATWLATIATVAFAVFVLHRFLHREKRRELENLETQLRAHVENPWEVSEYSIHDEDRETVDDIRDRIDRVSATREYPATFSIWTQLLLSVAIPKALQLFLAST